MLLISTLRECSIQVSIYFQSTAINFRLEWQVALHFYSPRKEKQLQQQQQKPLFGGENRTCFCLPIVTHSPPRRSGKRKIASPVERKKKKWIAKQKKVSQRQKKQQQPINSQSWQRRKETILVCQGKEKEEDKGKEKRKKAFHYNLESKS